MPGPVLLCGAFAALLLTVPALGASTLPVKKVEIAGSPVLLEVASRQEDRRRGLMGRRELARDSGMVFSFDPPQQVSMWMKGTLIDLDAAFIDACGMVTIISAMTAGTTDIHSSFGKVRWVIEMNRGWFAGRGIGTGAVIPALADIRYCSRKN